MNGGYCKMLVLVMALEGAGISVLRKFVVWPLMFSILFGAIGARAATGFSDDPVAVEKAAQSVLMLEVYSHGELIATGSGFVAFDSNMLITNSHVIEGADSILAKSDQGVEYVLDKVYEVDAKKDLAILGFYSPTDLSPLALDTDGGVMRVETVVAIGSPQGLLNTVSVGNVSAVFTEDGTRYIQFTAPVSSGSSGGALFNDGGEVIGITTSVLSNDDELVQNLNFAIHISEAAALREKINQKEWIPIGETPDSAKSADDLPEASGIAYDASGDEALLSLALTLTFFSPGVVLMALLAYDTPPAQLKQKTPQESLMGSWQDYLVGSLRNDKAYTFGWESLDSDEEGAEYYLFAFSKGAEAYEAYSSVDRDKNKGEILDVLLFFDVKESLRNDEAYTAIIKDLGVAFIRACNSKPDQDVLEKDTGGYLRCVDGYLTDGNFNEEYHVYGDLAEFDLRYTRANDGSPDYITLAYYVN